MNKIKSIAIAHFWLLDVWEIHTYIRHILKVISATASQVLVSFSDFIAIVPPDKQSVSEVI